MRGLWRRPRSIPTRPWYRAVYADNAPVGFVMISDGITVDNPVYVGPYFLWRLLIDRRFQGGGYGTATLDLVIEHVRTRPDAQVLLTSYAVGPTSPAVSFTCGTASGSLATCTRANPSSSSTSTPPDAQPGLIQWRADVGSKLGLARRWTAEQLLHRGQFLGNMSRRWCAPHADIRRAKSAAASRFAGQRRSLLSTKVIRRRVHPGRGHDRVQIGEHRPQRVFEDERVPLGSPVAPINTMSDNDSAGSTSKNDLNSPLNEALKACVTAMIRQRRQRTERGLQRRSRESGQHRVHDRASDRPKFHEGRLGGHVQGASSVRTEASSLSARRRVEEGSVPPLMTVSLVTTSGPPRLVNRRWLRFGSTFRRQQ